MGGIEIAAASLGVINVTLVVRRSTWNYPFGIAMVSLYFFVFWERSSTPTRSCKSSSW